MSQIFWLISMSHFPQPHIMQSKGFWQTNVKSFKSSLFFISLTERKQDYNKKNNDSGQRFDRKPILAQLPLFLYLYKKCALLTNLLSSL